MSTGAKRKRKARASAMRRVDMRNVTRSQRELATMAPLLSAVHRVGIGEHVPIADWAFAAATVAIGGEIERGLRMVETALLTPPLEGNGALISSCRTWRYLLWRTWDSRPRVVWIMCNPSTADAGTDDATIRKCCGFARRWDAGGIVVINVCALRAQRL